MPKNPHLVPTVITDVNGVTKTVHKKRPTAGKVSKIPAPEASSGKERMAVINAIAEYYDMTQDGGTKDQESRNEAKAVLDQYPTELLTKIHRCYLANSYSHRNITLMIFSKHNPTLLDEFITLLPYTTASVMRSEPVVRSLHMYKQLPQCENFAQQDERTQQQCAAIIEVASVMERYLDFSAPEALQWIRTPAEWVERDNCSDMLPMIRDDRMIDLLMERPEAGQRIAKFIKDRGSIDYDLILDVLANETPALVEGAL